MIQKVNKEPLGEMTLKEYHEYFKKNLSSQEKILTQLKNEDNKMRGKYNHSGSKYALGWADAMQKAQEIIRDIDYDDSFYFDDNELHG